MKDFDYQTSSSELDDIVTKLQAEDISVEEALALYERGNILAKELEKYLKDAKNKIEKVRSLQK